MNWQTDAEARKRDQHAILLSILSAAVLIATIVSLLSSQYGGFLGAVGIGGIIIFSGMAIGSIFGFLFSVPRVLSRENGPSKEAGSGGPAAGDAVATARRERLLATNTNLERISEWLTTMLVGVGLMQIGTLSDRALAFSQFIEGHARVFKDPAGEASAGTLPGLAPFLLVFGMVCGFIFFYLYTRIYLTALFAHAERSMDAGDEVVTRGAEKIQQAAAEMAAGKNDPTMRKAADAQQISVNQSLDVIFKLLYEKDGYKRVIEISNDLVKTPAVEKARYWYLMTCAFGQQHHDLLTQNAPAQAISDAKLAVYGAARQTMRLDPSYRHWLKLLTRAEADDNDLQDFADDEEFARIIR